MKKNLCNLVLWVAFPLCTACVSIPQETVTLSRVLGQDLQALHASHRETVRLYYRQVREDVHSFVDEVYAPFVIHYVLKNELDRYKAGKPSLYGVVELAGQREGKAEAAEALRVMQEFQEAARTQIEQQRQELLAPLVRQETELLSAIDQSYVHTQQANAAVTAYLQSVRKVKDAQQEALALAGLAGTDTLVTSTLVSLSDRVRQAVEKGKKIDVRSADAYRQLEAVSTQIKAITEKK